MLDVLPDAARAYDGAAVQTHGPDAKRNFPDEAISELPVKAGAERKQFFFFIFIGVPGTRPALHGKPR
jgi:hypothetical protein